MFAAVLAGQGFSLHVQAKFGLEDHLPSTLEAINYSIHRHEVRPSCWKIHESTDYSARPILFANHDQQGWDAISESTDLGSTNGYDDVSLEVKSSTTEVSPPQETL